MEIKCEYFVCNNCLSRFDWEHHGECEFVTDFDANKDWCDICDARLQGSGNLIEITIEDAISMILRDVLSKEATT